MTPREQELERLLAESRAAQCVLHRRVQHAEAKGPATRSRGRAKLAADCVRMAAALEEANASLGRIRAIAAGWAHQPFPPERMQAQALRDIEAEANQALGSLSADRQEY